MEWSPACSPANCKYQLIADTDSMDGTVQSGISPAHAVLWLPATNSIMSLSHQHLNVKYKYNNLEKFPIIAAFFESLSIQFDYFTIYSCMNCYDYFFNYKISFPKLFEEEVRPSVFLLKSTFLPKKIQKKTNFSTHQTYFSSIHTEKFLMNAHFYIRI